MTITIGNKKYLKEGSSTSGNFGHKGRPGEVGGSGSGGSVSDNEKRKIASGFLSGSNITKIKYDNAPYTPMQKVSPAPSRYGIARGRIKGLKGKDKGYSLAQTVMVDPKTGRGAWFKIDQYKRVVMGLGKRMNPKAKGPSKRIDYRTQLGMGGAKGVYNKLYGKGK